VSGSAKRIQKIILYDTEYKTVKCTLPPCAFCFHILSAPRLSIPSSVPILSQRLLFSAPKCLRPEAPDFLQDFLGLGLSSLQKDALF
jgi:hypothetical protein